VPVAGLSSGHASPRFPRFFSLIEATLDRWIAQRKRQ
jgi:hypothetical protein